MWFNIENNRMAKANSDGAVLRFKKRSYERQGRKY